MKPFVVTMGEPSGIGGELTLKAWTLRDQEQLAPFFTIDDIDRLRAIDPAIPIVDIQAPEQAIEVYNKALPVLHRPLNDSSVAGELNSKNSSCVIRSIEQSVELCLSGQAAGVVTNPIHKAVLQDVGFEYPGHTEFVAALCGDNLTPIMMLAAEGLKVVPLTVHIALKDVPYALSKDLIQRKVRILHRALIQDFGIDNPHIAVAGLNPHAGENGKMGLEEIEIISPAIETLKREDINVNGPYPADTMFHQEARAHYDAAIGIYHDQALIPLKTLDFHGGVNITLGLPIVRTSPDHGTALNIAGQGKARADSLINALKMAKKIVRSRNNS